jgi:ATP-dependent DNA helicase PIF1
MKTPRTSPAPTTTTSLQFHFDFSYIHYSFTTSHSLLPTQNMTRWLVNGTRMIVNECFEHAVQVQLITGEHTGEIVYLPRMDFYTKPDDVDCPALFIRRQFPVRLAFAITINKSAGQTLRRVGIYLPVSVHSHGMLYVALSRTGDKRRNIVMVDPNGRGNGTDAHGRVYTSNVVFQEII